MSSPVSRRSVLKLAAAGGGALALPGLLSACASDTSPGPTGTPTSTSSAAFVFPADVNEKWPAITSKQVVYANFGGESEEISRAYMYTPFTALTGAAVVDAVWDYGKFLNMISAPNPEWDTIDFDGFSTAGLIMGGTPPAKLADWVRRSDLVDAKYQDYVTGGYAWSIVMGWGKTLSGAPETWADYWDTSKFPGKRAFPKSIYIGTMEAALLADGVAMDAMYPLDFDRALAKFDELKKDMIFYDSAAQGQQMVAQGSASMILTASSKAIQLRNQGVGDFTYNEAVLYPWTAYPITLHSKNADAANAFVDMHAHPEIQAEMARRLNNGPTQSAAWELLDDDLIAKLPNSPDNKAKSFQIDTEEAAKADAEYAEKFYGWIGG